MDPNLQEFRDPELYDAENGWEADDDFYLDLAQEVGGPLLDVGCGTGRLTRALAAAGLDVTGLDIVPAMLARARALAGRLPIPWIEADCRSFTLDRRFRCLLMTGHAFQNLLTDADQDAFFARAAAHLLPGGTLAFETRNLQARTYGTTEEPTLWRSFRDPRGRWVDILVASRFDAGTSVDQVRLVRRVRETGESRPSRIALRYIDADDLERRLQEHGFTVEARYGDWSKRPFEPASSEIITVCRRRR